MPDPAANPPVSGTGPTRWDVRHFADIDSTNRYVLDEARAGAPSGLVAVADHQTAGRGRLGRRWEAAPGSALLVSVLLRHAQNGGELRFGTPEERQASAVRVGRMLQLIVASKEYQFA